MPHLASRSTLLLACVAATACAAPTRTSTSTAVPPGYTLERRGTADDFAYFEGGWTSVQRRLAARGVGSTEWQEFPATMCNTPYFAGHATVDELYMPSRDHAGLTVRLFDAKQRQWLIYWVNSAISRIDPVPMQGGFDGPRGEFYAVDKDAGRTVKVRYLWTKIDQDHARWEQAFSYDDRTWETNWTADFTRADTDAVCDRGRPRR